jgi:hypothetical protein
LHDPAAKGRFVPVKRRERCALVWREQAFDHAAAAFVECIHERIPIDGGDTRVDRIGCAGQQIDVDACIHWWPRDCVVSSMYVV